MMRSAVALLASLLALGAAAQPTVDPAAARCDKCGVVVSIDESERQEDWTPLGVTSNGPAYGSTDTTARRSAFVFGGDSKGELVVIGAAGGAVYAKRPNAYQKRRWDVTVKMDDGSQRVLSHRYEPFVRQGDRVRIVGTQLELV